MVLKTLTRHLFFFSCLSTLSVLYLHGALQCVSLLFVWIPVTLWKVISEVMISQWLSHILLFSNANLFWLNQPHCFPHCLLTSEQTLVWPSKAVQPCWGLHTIFCPFLLVPPLVWPNLQKTGLFPRARCILSPTQVSSSSFLCIYVGVVWKPLLAWLSTVFFTSYFLGSSTNKVYFI